MAKILQSPIILPPESISKNTITQQAFSLGRAFAVTFQISSSNLKLIATESTDENGEIITEYTSEPDTDKELGFSIFLTDDTDARTFGASAGRCGWIDYSTKGEVAEGINDSGNKVIIDFEDETGNINTNLDLLLDHVYPENVNNLVKNQTPGLKSIFSMLFLSNKTFFNAVTDIYGNLYYDSLIVDTDGNVTDFLTGELKPISEYQAPVVIQYSIGENIHYMVYDFIFEDKPIDILNINYYTFRLLFENHGGILTLEIMKPGETFYRPCMTKELPYNYYGNHNIRFGFGQFTPLFSYDIDKKADFNIHNIQLQQSDERPDWLKILDKELKNLLDMDTFNTELLGAENKLILHTDRISDDKLQAIETLLEKAVPQNIEVVQYNHNMEISWRDINKYAECVTVDDLMAVNPDFRNDLTGDGSWVYPLNSFNGSFAEAFRAPAMPFVHADFYLPALTTAESGANWYVYPELETLKIIAPLLKIASSAFVGSPKLRIVHAYLPEATDVSLMFYTDTSVERVTGFFPEVTVGAAFLNVGGAARGGPVMTCELKFPKLSNGQNMFNYCRLDKQSTLCILNSIPEHSSGSHALTIGIHIDLQNDADVLTAIANAKAKGWNMEVQWNGKSTSGVSTLDLEEIYAKVTESEYGEYTDENGTRCALNWGHYVTNQSEYKLFYSLVEAEQYFKLTRIENNE